MSHVLFSGRKWLVGVLNDTGRDGVFLRAFRLGSCESVCPGRLQHPHQNNESPSAPLVQ